MDLFSGIAQTKAPLADRLRPKTLDDFLGQKHLLAEGKLLRRAILSDRLTSSIFYGPPGCGKTTLAAIIANTTKSAFEKLNAVSSGVKELREVIDRADERLKLYGISTYLLLDECHRWSKAQSDCILPALESGIIKFIGSTTENPMAAMTGAIVSRCRLFAFYSLSQDDIEQAIMRAITDKADGFGDMNIEILPTALAHLSRVANGDVRTALNAIELAVLTTQPDKDDVIHITDEIASESIQQKILRCGEDQYYDMLSAFCKSLRGSDSDAALAWFARLLYAGVDPKLIARRLVAHASEDVGLANPQAMQQAITAFQAVQLVGLPEARLSLSQAIIYICECPKSNAVCVAIDAAMADAASYVDESVPYHLRDTTYKEADPDIKKTVYQYPHEFENHYIPQQYMPPSVQGKVYYHPSQQGQEVQIAKLHTQRKKWQPDTSDPKQK